MRWTVVIAMAAAVGVTIASWPAEAQTRRAARQTVEEDYPGQRQLRGNRGPTRITVRRQRSYLDPGTEVLPLSRNYTDYALPLNHYPPRIWDTTNHYRGALPSSFYLPNFP